METTVPRHKSITPAPLVALLVLSTLVTAGGQGADTYVLPFPTGVGRKLLQGYGGPYGHSGLSEFAYDFEMPIGSSVLASRSGEVVHLVEHHRDSTRRPGEENVVVIKHVDGTFARYYHLTTDGVLVALGDRVTQGQRIALSGDSGASAGAHLHFDVTKDCYEYGKCQTVAIRFSNVTENPLNQGAIYDGPQ
jgi:murein DD-endopeptidase MepM/ murein hydrolase activator NlpD